MHIELVPADRVFDLRSITTSISNMWSADQITNSMYISKIRFRDTL